MAGNSKAYDLVVYGATGFTGRLVAEYLAKSAGPTVWAIGGRSRSKLDAVKRELGLQVDILEADSFDVTAIRAMVKQTRAVISLVGPYNIYGTALYQACAEEGCHYFDLTGEIPFCLGMMKQHGPAAVRSGALMIHSCGWDSVPSDLCTYLAVQELQRAKPSAKVGLVETGHKFQGGFSGGTIASFISMFDTPKAQLAGLGNPFILSPIGAPNRRHKHAAGTPFAKKLLTGARGGFFIMAFHNTKIVYQTFGILESLAKSSGNKQFHYGEDFHYQEYHEHPSAIASALVSGFILLFTGLLTLRPLRNLFQRFAPVSGEGPSKSMRENGWWRATTVALEHEGTAQAKVIIKGKKDPGYGSTSMLISECALAVLQNRDQLPAPSKTAGPLTPASALGNVLKERLEKTGFYSFEISSRK